MRPSPTPDFSMPARSLPASGGRPSDDPEHPQESKEEQRLHIERVVEGQGSRLPDEGPVDHLPGTLRLIRKGPQLQSQGILQLIEADAQPRIQGAQPFRQMVLVELGASGHQGS